MNKRLVFAAAIVTGFVFLGMQTGVFATGFQAMSGDAAGVGDNTTEANEPVPAVGGLFALTDANSFCTAEYDNCNSNRYEYGEAVAYSILEYNDLDFIGKRNDGAFVVEPGTTVRYRCRQDVGPDSQDTSAALMDAQGQDPSIKVTDDGREITVTSGENIPVEGELDVSFDTARNVQLVCASLGWDSYWWAYSGSWSWFNAAVVEATDTDDDGFYDVNDACPNEGDLGFGLQENGCPIRDSDGDGVPNPQDKCRGDAGGEFGVDDQGCPLQDADNDGVLDRDDACPETFGTQADGCPTLIDRVFNVLPVDRDAKGAVVVGAVFLVAVLASLIMPLRS